MNKIKYLILLFFITISVMYYINYKEGFKSDYSDYTTIDRIKTGTNSYAYCIAGNVMCPSGNRVRIMDNYKKGKTYNYSCGLNAQAECRGNFQYKMNSSNRSDWKTPSAREISFPYSDDYKGFTIPYTYIPVDICNNFMNFYDSSHNVIDNINKCSMLKSDIESYKCNIAYISKLAEMFENGITTFMDGFPIGDALKKLIKPKTETSNIKCIANYGTTVGKPLCCGQTGVLQKSATEYVCPASKPTCAGYTCGDEYGTCS